MNIVILDANTLTLDNDIDFSVFNQYGDVTIYQSSTDEEVGERIKDAEVVLCNKTVLNADKLSKAPNLKYIGLFATGYNNIDIDYTRAHSITVCNAGDYSTEAVAQHVFAFILHEYNTVDKYNTFVKNEGWVNAETFSPFFAMRELQGKTIGVIGYGSIGRKVADVARVFATVEYVIPLIVSAIAITKEIIFLILFFIFPPFEYNLFIQYYFIHM